MAARALALVALRLQREVVIMIAFFFHPMPIRRMTPMMATTPSWLAREEQRRPGRRLSRWAASRES